MAVNLETVIDDLGGCGRYQVLLCLIVHLMKVVVAWSTSVMIFEAVVPSWACAMEAGNMTENVTQSWTQSCFVNQTECSSFAFNVDDFNSIVSEWSLLCGNAWIPATLNSIQVAGLLAGNLLSGHLADAFGRKSQLYLSMAILVVFNFVAYFSVSWVMLAVVRVFLGIGSGFFLTIQYNIMSEFALPRYRSVIVAFPSWFLEIAAFALVAWLLQDWRGCHLATAILGLPFLLTWWFVPESFRWYVTQDRGTEAETVVRFIARINRRPVPDTAIIRQMIEEDAKAEAALRARKYTVIDLFRTRFLVRISLLSFVNWFALGLVAYGIQFGIPSLSGSVFLNVFLFNIICTPSSFVSAFLCNRIGRRKTADLCYLITALGAFGVGIVQYIDTDAKDSLTNGFALVSFLGISTAWAPVQMMTIESYPTVVRNIGYGFANIFARVGMMIGPQIAYFDEKLPGSMFFICGAVSVVCLFTTLAMPETKDVAMKDKLKETEMDTTC